MPRILILLGRKKRRAKKNRMNPFYVSQEVLLPENLARRVNFYLRPVNIESSKKMTSAGSNAQTIYLFFVQILI